MANGNARNIEYITNFSVLFGQVRLLFFAKSREIVGRKEAELEVVRLTTPRDVLQTLLQEYPGLGEISDNIVLSLNEEYLEIDDQQIVLEAGDELAIIPPISGG
ncbi:hypothetical protein BaRGS_00008998 [Batillaria attramentaria]|uniref:Molybdopterin synthase sulfur carrier subunit n=1 Tax=Batillaria attramentaria TaxID=370345 RepID=A0ABD0LK33_9CAEN